LPKLQVWTLVRRAWVPRTLDSPIGYGVEFLEDNVAGQHKAACKLAIVYLTPMKLYLPSRRNAHAHLSEGRQSNSLTLTSFH